jgi:hypothetical protein
MQELGGGLVEFDSTLSFFRFFLSLMFLWWIWGKYNVRIGYGGGIFSYPMMKPKFNVISIASRIWVTKSDSYRKMRHDIASVLV